MRKSILIALWVSAVGYGLYAAWSGDQTGVRGSMAAVVLVLLWSRCTAACASKKKSSNHST